jgi:cytidylate kinase
MINIAIDGPSGAGKSTLSKKLAQKLGYLYVDTGALYRAIGLYVLRQNKNCKNEAEVTSLLNDIKITLNYENNSQHIYLNGEDVSTAIRKEEVGMAASDVSAHKAVRAFLLKTQADLAKTNNVIMDGRDIGTVVLPKAQIKIFLTASPEDRARRRYLELCEKGETPIYEDILTDVKTRDYNDSHRQNAPLKQADDAILADTTGNTFDETFEMLLGIINGELRVEN